MRVVLAGNRAAAANCLRALLSAGHEVQCVFGVEEDPSRPQWSESLPAAAAACGVRVVWEPINDCLPVLRELAPDLLLSVQYAFRISAEVLSVPSRGAYNLHFGALPEYRGCNPVLLAVWNGESHATATMHEMLPAIDAGPVIGTIAAPIGPHSTTRELYDRLSELAPTLLSQQVRRIEAGAATPCEQHGSSRYYYRSAVRYDRDRVVSWSERAVEVHNRIRAFTFPPLNAAAAEIGGELCEVVGSRLVDVDCRIRRFGQLVGIGGETALFAARDGAVGIATINGVSAAAYVVEHGVS